MTTISGRFVIGVGGDRWRLGASAHVDTMVVDGPVVASEHTAEHYSAEQFAQWNIVNRVVPAADPHETALAVAKKIARGPAMAHTQTKRIIRHALTHDSRTADRLVLDEATRLYETRDMQNAVGHLLEQGARKFMQNHHEIVFEGR